jgi:tetratricopeptide (TPR) repeat protein
MIGIIDWPSSLPCWTPFVHGRRFMIAGAVWLGLLAMSAGAQQAMSRASAMQVKSPNGRVSAEIANSLRIEQKLLAQNPSNPQYLLQVARLETQLHNNVGARKSLTTLLRIHPLNRQARLDLAQLDLSEGKLEQAYGEFHTLLGQNFQDPEALYGAAKIDYYRNDLHRALPLAANLVEERPRDFDALMLLARIERALHQKKIAMALVERASQLSPDNQELKEFRKAIHEESSVEVHTSASYAREISVLSPLPGPPAEDLNTYGAATRVDFALLPETSSYFLTASMPSNSPLGGIQGAVAPAEFLYGQTTQLSNEIVVRGGLGLVRMGPGEFFNAGSPVRSVGIEPVGYAGSTVTVSPQLKLSVTASQTAITYTPASTRFGVRQRRAEAELEYNLDSRTRATMSVFHDWEFSPVYEQTQLPVAIKNSLEENGHDWGTGAHWAVTRNLIRSEWISLDTGYTGMALGYAGQRRGVYMGFFNSAFYQQHLLTTELNGKFWGPVHYSLIADAGVQQTDQGEPLSLAEKVGPGLVLHVSRQISMTVSYIHYNFAQSLGTLKGNVIELSTDYRF